MLYLCTIGNALVHRDFSTLGAVHVKLDDDGLNISSPGGFIEGVSLDNLLVVPPRSRNPLLADIIKRIGLAERTGRGIDRIYEGMLRYGRPLPDYSQSNPYTVTVILSNAEADRDFLKMVVEQEDKLGNMPIDSLRDLENTKLPFIVSSYYKRGGAQYEDIDFGSEWSIARTGGFDFAFG